MFASVAAPPSVAEPPPHGSEQVEPAAQVSVLPALHLTVHAVAPPHTIVQPELPLQSPVQPPFGQLIVQVLLPVHATVEPVSTVTLHVLPPPQVTVLSVPVDVPFRFAYGPGSFRRHAAEARRLGLGFRVVRDPELAFDVDVPDDVDRLGLLTDPLPRPR